MLLRLVFIFSVAFPNSITKAESIRKNESELKIIANFISRLDNIGEVELHTCWSSKSIITFQKLIFKPSKHVKTISRNNFIDTQLIHIFDLHCENTISNLLKINKTSMFKAPSKWIILADNIHDLPAGLDIFLDSRVYIISKNVVYLLYKLQNQIDYKTQIVCTVENDKVKSYKAVADYTNRRNTEGSMMKAAMVVSYHNTYKDMLEFRNLDKDHYSKFFLHQSLYVVEACNATFVPFYIPIWGNRIGNTSNYDGLFGMLQRDETDFGSSPAFIAPDRTDFIEYTNKFPGSMKLIFRSPPLSVVKNILRMPLQDNVWLSIFFLLILEFPILLIIVKWEWFKKDQLNNKGNILHPRLLDIAQLQVGAVFQQGSEAEPKSLSGHIASLIIFLSFLFFFTAYSACIVALLQSVANNLNTLDDMSSSDIRVKIDNMPYMPFIIGEALKSKSAQILYNTKIAPHGADINYVTLREGIIDCIRDDFCACFVDEDRAFKAINRLFTDAEKCGLKWIWFTAATYPYMPIRKGTPYRELLRVGLANVKQIGIWRRNFLRIIQSPPKCENPGGIFRSVGLTDCYFALLCFVAGIGITLIVFVMELVFHKYTSKSIKYRVNVLSKT